MSDNIAQWAFVLSLASIGLTAIGVVLCVVGQAVKALATWRDMETKP